MSETNNFIKFALELLQQPDSLGGIGVGAEHGIRLGHPAREFHVVVEFFVGMYYVELRHVAPVDIVKTRIVRNFLQGRGQGQRVSAEFGTAGIGHVFACAGNGHTGKPAEEIPDGAPYDKRHQEQDDSEYGATAAAIFFAAVGGAAAGPSEQPHKHSHCHGPDGRKNPDEYDTYHHQAGVPILDVGQFVPDDGGQFRII